MRILLLCALSYFSLAVGVFPAASQTLSQSAELVDFDRPFGFSKPLRVTVFRAVRDDKAIFLFLPSQIAVDESDAGNDILSLSYVARSRRTYPETAQLTGQLIFENKEDIDFAISEIRDTFPDAQFALPVPKEASVGFSGPGMKRIEVSVPGAVSPLRGTINFSIPISKIAARSFLNPGSYKYEVGAVDYTFVLKGISRNLDGASIFEERVFSVGATVRGFCAIRPTSVVNINTQDFGCIHQNYSRRLILPLQRALAAQEIYSGPLDGVFGPITERAIRRYQASIGVVVDGTPSVALLENISN